MVDQRHAPFLEALEAYAGAIHHRFHIPGHKGGPAADASLIGAFGERAALMDIPAFAPLIEGRRQAEAVAAAAWGAGATRFLTGGASEGNHLACLMLAQAGSEIVVARNLHSSAIDGLVLSGLRPSFVAPELDPELGIAHCVTPEALDEALRRGPAAGAMVTSPTYYGAVADVRGLADTAHAHGVPLVVDEAWGAHLAFHERLPEDALSAGADVVVSSTHKLLGSLTGAAMVHLSRDAPAPLDEPLLERTLTLIESTSPSPLLLGSLDAARRRAATRGAELLELTLSGVEATRRAVRAAPGLRLLEDLVHGRPGVHRLDPLQLAIDVSETGATGHAIDAALRERQSVQVELSSDDLVLAVFGMGEPAAETGARLVEALRRVTGAAGAPRHRPERLPPPPYGEVVASPRDAFLGPQETVAVEAAAGRVAAETLAVYPPGVPNVLPGERLTSEILDHMRATIAHGATLYPATDPSLRSVRVVRGVD